MPALSKQQQKLFGLALAVKRGDVPKSKVSDEIKGIVNRMSEKDIEKFASTKHKGLPSKVEMEMESLINKIEEKWSDKYKRSIDCNNPKGFSQKAHCKGRKKNESNVKQSAGLLMYKNTPKGLEVFIGKLGGRKWKKRSRNWSIPKGLVDSGETPIMAAIREFEEETGIKFNGKKSDLVYIGVVSITDPQYPKDVKVWAFEGDGKFKGSNKFKEEWPEGSGKYVISPEVSTAGFYPIDTAMGMVHSYQVPALNKLKNKLKNILKEQQLPKVLYHSVTDERTRDFVLKNGIKMDNQGFVYLSKKPITRLPFKYTFKVKIPNMDALYDWRDVWDDGLDKEYDKTNPYYIYNNDIPKQYIKLI
tara:strand:+ start:826 stop:1905 length:1080 start_codon:yes stop_codon:yes gene_type:complete